MSVEERTKTEHDGVDVDALLEIADVIFDRADKLEKMGDAVAVAHGADVNCIVTYPSDTVRSWGWAIRSAVNGANPSKSRELPEGIEWPRFENGELVMFGDRFVGYHAKSDQMHEDTVSSIHFKQSGYKINGTVNRHTYSYGEPVKRPEPEVLDADGVPIKVGDTVYTAKGKELMVESINRNFFEDGEEPEHLVWCGEYIKESYPLHHIANQLTHRKPDSMEAIEADIKMDPRDYCDKHGLTEKNLGRKGYTVMCEHILMRQRKLLGGE